MKTWQEVKESANYERLKNSLELRFAKRNLLVYGIFTVVLGLLSALVVSSGAVRAKSVVGMILVVTVFVPSTVFYLYRIFMIFYRMDDYSFTEVVLDKPHGGIGRDAMYFDVTVRDRFGAEINVQTHEIFSSRSNELAPLEDYINKKVLIGYNNVTQYVVVIG